MTVPATRPSARARPTRPVQPRLRLVPSPVLRPPRTPFVVLVVGLLGVGLVGLLVLNTVIAENSFRMHELRKSTAALSLQEQQLQREIDDLEAPGALAIRARRLGMVPAGNPAFIRLSDGSVLGVPTPATAPPRPAPVRPSPNAASSPAPAAPAVTPSPAQAPARSPAPAASPVARR